MALPEVDNLHHTLMRFAERTNDLVCSANSNLERLVNHHPPGSLPSLAGDGERGYSLSLTETTSLEGRTGKISHFYVPFRLGRGGPSSDAAARVTSVRKQSAPSIRPGLPVEILDEIFCLLTQQQLLPVLLSNSFLYQIARRRFYHTIDIKSPTDTIAFLKSLLHNPELPPLVRSFELSIAQTEKKHTAVCHSPVSSATSLQPISNSTPTPSTTSSTPLFTHNFYSLLHRGLRAMHSLLSLTLELPKPHSPVWIFDECTFMLRQFTTSMHCNCQLADFLERQEMIEELTLRGFQTESLFFLPFLGATAAALVTQASSITTTSNTTTTTDNLISPLSFTLSPFALSRLKSFNAIHAGPAIVHTIMQGRSVEIASIPLFPERSVPTLNALGSGKAPLRRLSVISFDPGAPESLFEELARRFKDLEALHLVLLMADYSNGLFEDYGRILSNFKSLKYITFMAAATNESTLDEVKVAKDWHRACPTLRTIILPKGSVWFQGEADHEMQEDDVSSSGSPSYDD